MRKHVTTAALAACVAFACVALTTPSPVAATAHCPEIHGTAAEWDGSIVYVCETQPRWYCNHDGSYCWLESDVYIQTSECPIHRIP